MVPLLRLLAISIIFVNYMVEDLVVEWMWLDAVYEFCGGEVTKDERMKMRREIVLRARQQVSLILGNQLTPALLTGGDCGLYIGRR